MAHLENEQINANALIDKMVKKSRAAQSSLGKSNFAKRCAALQSAAAAIRAQSTAIWMRMYKMWPVLLQTASTKHLLTG